MYPFKFAFIPGTPQKRWGCGPFASKAADASPKPYNPLVKMPEGRV